MPKLPDLRIAHALLLTDGRGVRVLAQSPGFDVPEAERIAVLFGRPPSGVSCPPAHFACPFGKDRVAVVQVMDHPPESLAFRFLVLARELYRHLGDPFAIADRYPPDWNAAGTLPELAWPPEPLPRRTVEQIDNVLKHGDVALLLGGTQALVDGSKLVLKRATPDEVFFRGLWQLLPDRTRCDLWPASFAFSLDLGFHAAALPDPPPLDPHLIHDEERAKDYPEGNYEWNVQFAAEHGDQAGLDKLFARRTSKETLRLVLLIIGVSLLVAVISKFVLP